MAGIGGVIATAAVALALAFLPPAVAGNLSKCDQERLAARSAVLARYEPVLAELDQRIAAARAAGTDPGKAVYRDQNDQSRPLDLLALRADLQAQEAHDAGGADKAVAASCGDRAETVTDAAKLADALAARGLAAVLTKHLTNVDLSRDPPRF
jgi:hypothetical protein